MPNAGIMHCHLLNYQYVPPMAEINSRADKLRFYIGCIACIFLILTNHLFLQGWATPNACFEIAFFLPIGSAAGGNQYKDTASCL
jgi:hypothetical protein